MPFKLETKFKMIKLRYPACTQNCPLYLNHHTDTCSFDYHMYGRNQSVPAHEGAKCPHHGKEVPKKAYPFKLDFDKIRAQEGKLETKHVAED